MAQYEQDNTFNFVSKNSKDLTSLKQNIEWLKIPPSTALQQTLRNLDHSLKQSFKNANSRKGFPTFKKKKFNSTSFNLTMISSNNFINDNIFKIPKIGEVKIKLHRKPPSDFKSCAVKQKAGKWYVSFVVKKECKQKQPISSAIGIDMNSKDLVVTSESEVIKNPKFYSKTKSRIKWLQKALARKKLGSQNWHKALLKLQRAYDKMGNQRSDHLHKLSRYLVDNYDLIAMEDLNVAGMAKFNGHMVQDAGWSTLRAMITYKPVEIPMSGDQSIDSSHVSLKQEAMRA